MLPKKRKFIPPEYEVDHGSYKPVSGSVVPDTGQQEDCAAVDLSRPKRNGETAANGNGNGSQLKPSSHVPVAPVANQNTIGKITL